MNVSKSDDWPGIATAERLWRHGWNTSDTSCGVVVSMAAACKRLEQMVRCVSATPFGMPDVPLEYITRATSSADPLSLRVRYILGEHKIHFGIHNLVCGTSFGGPPLCRHRTDTLVQ